MKLRNGKMYTLPPEYYPLEKDVLKKYYPPGYVLRELKWICGKHYNLPVLRDFLTAMFRHGYFGLESSFVKTLLRDVGIDSSRKAKYLMPFILDNWNITEENGFNDFEVYLYKKDKCLITDELPAEKINFHKIKIKKYVVEDDNFCNFYHKDNNSIGLWYECF